MTFAYPWLLALLPLPLLLRWILPAHSEAATAVRIPMFEVIQQASQLEPTSGASVRHRPWWAAVLLFVCWCGIVVALARPQRLLPPESREIATRDLMLAIDLSGSMETKDFTNEFGERIDRLSAVQGVLQDFLTNRRGDRVGMIVFGTGAFVQIPFTQDLDVCRQLVDELEVRMAGPKTAFGDAIGLAINVFDRSELDDKVLIVLTDGNDTGSRIPPSEAAAIAAEDGIVIHTIGVGDPEAAGEEILDEQALQDVAKTTRGEYFFAEDRQALASVYDRLDTLDVREVETVTHRPKQDAYYWPLSLALLVSFVGPIYACARRSLRAQIHSSEDSDSDDRAGVAA